MEQVSVKHLESQSMEPGVRIKGRPYWLRVEVLNFVRELALVLHTAFTAKHIRVVLRINCRSCDVEFQPLAPDFATSPHDRPSARSYTGGQRHAANTLSVTSRSTRHRRRIAFPLPLTLTIPRIYTRAAGRPRKDHQYLSGLYWVSQYQFGGAFHCDGRTGGHFLCRRYLWP